jgi:hypothetical protein
MRLHRSYAAVQLLWLSASLRYARLSALETPKAAAAVAAATAVNMYKPPPEDTCPAPAQRKRMYRQ